mmetsp:Transcript_70011/g.116680  ORF Transcript_70011/g.116680 Transcript_70011/m.116680 type:complete len:134 (-) Transcript_70011:1828-2229(-)
MRFAAMCTMSSAYKLLHADWEWCCQVHWFVYGVEEDWFVVAESASVHWGIGAYSSAFIHAPGHKRSPAGRFFCSSVHLNHTPCTGAQVQPVQLQPFADHVHSPGHQSIGSNSSAVGMLLCVSSPSPLTLLGTL